MSFGRLGAFGRGFGRLGGLRSGVSAPDITAPTITSASAANCAENATLAHTLTANEGVSWSIVGGADQARFEISGSTLRWLGNGTKDFEAPDDSGANNTYVVDVRATDSATNTADQTITITVTDVAEGGAVDISFTDSSVITTDLSTYTFSTQALGAEAADRKIIVGMGHRGTNTNITSITVAGVAATSVVEAPASGLQSDRACIYIADVPTGTTGDVVVTFSAGQTRCGIGVWRMTGAASSTPTDTGVSAADPATNTLTISANGGGVGYGFSVGATATATWGGLTSEDFDEVVEATITHTGAHLNSVAGGDIAAECNWSGAGAPMNVAFASWAP